MAKKKATPILTRNVGKDKVVRFFVKGTSRQVSNKKNEASILWVRQNFDRLVASPSAQANLTKQERDTLRNTINARKGREKSAEKAKQRFRFNNKFVGKDIQRTIDFNPVLKRALGKRRDLSNIIEFQGLQTKAEVLERLSDLLDSQIQKIGPKKAPNGIDLSSAIIDNNDWINEDRDPRTEQDFSGTFNKLVEVLDIMSEINAQRDKTKPKSILKVITRNGDILFGSEAQTELEKFVAQTTKAQFDKDPDKRGVAVKFFFPYKVVFPEKGAPEFTIDLNRFNEDDDNYFQFETSEMPVTLRRRSA